jgi:phospholipid/cholesterol/gamma-HCH transport system substrate-binding protein
VLHTQQANAGNIRAFARGMAEVTGALRRSDGNIRTILQGGPGTLAQIQALLKGLEPSLPILLSNLVTINQVVDVRLPSVQQLLVTYPVVIASGFSGTTPDGYGHVHLENTQDPPPCEKGFLPPSKWRPTDDLSDAPVYLQAHCASGPPYVMRGPDHVPRPHDGSARVAPYDPTTGILMDGNGKLILGGAASDVYGEDAWKWMLVGPTVEK